MKRLATLSILSALFLPVAAFAQTKLPPGAEVVKLEVSPASIELKTPYEYRQLLITGILKTGDRVDLTRAVDFVAPASVKISDKGQVRPAGDGDGQIKVTLQKEIPAVAGLNGNIAVKVSGQKAAYEVSFVKDVMPTMSRIGCNLGTCHGSAQ